MREVKVIGVGMTPFGKFPGKSLKDLAGEACKGALADAGLGPGEIQAAVAGNAVGGLITGQECVRGQVALRPLGVSGVQITNVENASGSGGSAFNLAWLKVASGDVDVALALGMEKLYHPKREKINEALAAAMDIEMIGTFLGVRSKNGDLNGPSGSIEPSSSEPKSIFMDFYAMEARRHMQEYGITQQQLALISAKNHFHASLNPLAQYQKPYTAQQVLDSPLISYPLTRLMCSPISDGAAAAVLASAEFVKKRGLADAITVAASVEGSGMDRSAGAPDISERVGRKAYERAGIGPEEIDLAEAHDATAFQELLAYEHLGFCKKGEGGLLAEQGHSRLDGKRPVNTSGGLEARGHPLGACGLAQVHEAVTQLRGRAGKRQVKKARTALVHNGGGAIGIEAAAVVVHILKV